MAKEALVRNKRAVKQALHFFEAGTDCFKHEMRCCDDTLDAFQTAFASSTPFGLPRTRR